MTNKQKQIADLLDSLKVNDSIEFYDSFLITRVSEYSYKLNDEKYRYGFVELYDILVKV